MCLFTEEREPRIADRDITCYKVVSVRGGKYYTPYVKRRIQKRYIIGRDLYCAHGELNIKNCSNAFYVAHRFANNNQFFAIGKGFIHTCGGTAEEAFKHVGSDQQLFECIIPKGTKCWKSKDGVEYASRSIRFVKPCEEQIRALFSERMGRFPAEDELSVIVGSIEQTKKFFKTFA